jgi:hypothetical protein
MKISELLLENTDKKRHKTAAKQAPADNLDDNLDDNLNDIKDDSEDADLNDKQKDIDDAVETFKKFGSKFGPDLYSFSSINYYSGWDARNSYNLTANFDGIRLEGAHEAIGAMSEASGYMGSMTFIILNGRSGEIVAAGFGENAISDGIVMDTLDSDQMPIVKRINAANKKYTRAGGGYDEETSHRMEWRDHIEALLKYHEQSIKTDEPERMTGIRSYDEWSDEEKEETAAYAQEILKQIRAERAAKRAEKEAKKAAKLAASKNPAGRNKR